MMLECNPGELLTRAAFRHHGDQGHDAIRYHAVLKGLNMSYQLVETVCSDRLAVLKC